MKEAMFYDRKDKNRVRCYLCAHHCLIESGKRGICGVRENDGGKLYSLVYGKLISMNIDPIEKKPLFHVCPGTTSFSVATAGCNFRCRHCQNFDISQYPRTHDDIPGETVSPAKVVDAAEQHGCRTIAYTYTEPTIFFEFAYDCACLAHERGLKNIFVSNGYTGPEATKAIAPLLDANNIDLKGNENFYREICGARLQPVLDTIALMKQLGVWVELTTLIIPSYNDDQETIDMIVDFIRALDVSIPWHVSRFYPTYLLTDVPGTPVETLRRVRETGIRKGLRYVYEGNVPGEGGENTYCWQCGELLIERTGYQIGKIKVHDGVCSKCSAGIDGIWRC